MKCWILAQRSKKKSTGRSLGFRRYFGIAPQFTSPSSPGEFHPQALTDPDVTVSRHPARIISPPNWRLGLTPWLLPSLVDQTVSPDDPTPSLHLHYRDFCTTTSWSVPVPCIGTLTLMGSSHLSFSLNIRTTGSHVPHKSQIQVHATCMPDATQTVSRFPLDLSWSSERPPVLTSPFCFRHLISGSLPLVSLNLT